MVVNTPEDTALVLTFVEPGLPALHDLTSAAADLVLLALSEPASPAGPAGEVEMIEPGRVSLVTHTSLEEGALVVADPDTAERCFAALINQFSGEVLTFDVATVLTLMARGVAIQITSGLAATAARDLDDDLRRLGEAL